MSDRSDQQLLREYSEHGSEAAFAEIVRRHVDFVYSSALRMVRDSHTAQDVAQNVFVALARKARHLPDHPVLTGWLHRTARNLSANAVRSQVRRRARELEASTMNHTPSDAAEAGWKMIALHLDAGLEALGDADRDAVLLRYFERKSAREMALVLGTSEEAAQKRVNRAVERLREYFSRRGVTVGASGLVLALSSHAVQSAPAELAVAISSAVATGQSSGTAILSSIATKAIAMTTQQKIILAALGLLVCGTVTVVLTRDATAPTAGRQADKPDPDAFVGQYEMVGHRIVLAKEGNGLAAIIDGQPAFVAYPQSETKFLSHDHDSLSELIFSRNSSGQVVELTLIRDGRKLGDLKRSNP